MKRNGIDFTAGEHMSCCICGSDKQLSRVVVAEHKDYTDLHVCLCGKCLERVPVKDGRVKDLQSIVESVISDAKRAFKKIEAENSIFNDYNLGLTFDDLTSIPIDKEISRRETTFVERRNELQSFLGPDPLYCPVCFTPISLSKNINDLEIEDKFDFSCDCKCCHFTEDAIRNIGKKLYGHSSLDYQRSTRLSLTQKCFNLAYKSIYNNLTWFLHRKNNIVKKHLNSQDQCNIWDENAHVKAKDIYAKQCEKYYPELKPGAKLDIDKLLEIVRRINVPSEKCNFNCNGKCINPEVCRWRVDDCKCYEHDASDCAFYSRPRKDFILPYPKEAAK